ncbi:MAG: ribonuclease catalytic domain-containing protein, partial [Candidatus Nanohaloarchaea archaeon]|nr:ribonuclease catalytic domain-containing protein [Candidatus Nanohaloarchaea archaeon]
MTDNIHYWQDLKAEFDIPEKYHDDHPAVQEAQDMEVDIDTALEERGEYGDLRDLTAFTIDPPDAQDFDDAVSIEETDQGYRTWVHIADVSHYVEPGSELDRAAEERGVTFYLQDNTRHMLPEELSTELCSLVPEEERLAATVEMEMDEHGNVKDYDIYKSVIESDARFSYDEADKFLEEAERQDQDPAEILSKTTYTDDADIAESLLHLDELTEQIKEDNWDSRLYLNSEDSASSRIIEEMMIKANECVGDYCQNNGIPAMFRTEADPEKGWKEEVREELEDLGYHKEAGWLAENKFEKLNDFMTHEVQDGDINEARKAIVTKLPRARYEIHGMNHFALNTRPYAHFTSPIRRDADLKTHQMIFSDRDEFDAAFE